MTNTDTASLNGTLDVKSIASLHQTLCDVDTDHDQHIDMSNVIDVDTSAIQLLLALRANCLRSDSEFSTLGLSSSVCRTMANVGALKSFQDQTPSSLLPQNDGSQ